ncbi:MAG: amidohydrolase family protein, partial [Cyanobacteria bacterium J06649_11]
IKEAKNKGLNVTCDVALHQLLLNEQAVMGYDTNVKVNPPLRSELDRQALVKGVKDGVIDVISSHHLPQDEENKKMEFDLADYGMISIQTFFPLINRLADEVPFDTLLKCFTENPRKILGLDVNAVTVGNESNLTLFDKNQEWVFDKASNLSKSDNSPFLGQPMKGKVVGLVNGEKSIFNL